MAKVKTLKMIAEIAGVSRTTVSRVINNSDKVNAETADRVKKIIEELDYQPNELARSLRKSSTNTIGIIISNILNPFFTSIVRVIEDCANENNYNVIICNTDQDIEKEKAYVQTLINRQVDGLIIATTGNVDGYDKLVGNVPVVFIDRVPKEEDIKSFDIVLVENENSTFEGIKFLFEQGYKNIGIILGDDVSTTGYERLQGYKKACKYFDIPIREELIKVGSFLGDETSELVLELLNNTDCDCIFTSNSIILQRTLTEINKFRGREIDLMTFDDLEWFDFSSKKINSIQQPTTAIGEKAMHLLLERISGSESEFKLIRYPTKLIIRE